MFFFRLAISLSEDTFHCALAARVTASLKVFRVISAFSPAERL